MHADVKGLRSSLDCTFSHIRKSRLSNPVVLKRYRTAEESMVGLGFVLRWLEPQVSVWHREYKHRKLDIEWFSNTASSH